MRVQPWIEEAQAFLACSHELIVEECYGTSKYGGGARRAGDGYRYRSIDNFDILRLSRDIGEPTAFCIVESRVSGTKPLKICGDTVGLVRRGSKDTGESTCREAGSSFRSRSSGATNGCHATMVLANRDERYDLKYYSQGAS